MRTDVVAALGLWLVCTVAPPYVQACSGIACGGVQLAPSAGTVPANLPAFWARYGAYEAAPEKVLELIRTDRPGSIPIGDDLTLLRKLDVGGNYQVTLRLRSPGAWCADKELTSSFVAGPEAALPSTLGEPVVVAQGLGATAVGLTNASCYTSLASAYVDLEPSLLPLATPWRDTIVNVRAVVDGQDYWVSSEEQPAESYYPTGGSGVRPATGGDLRVRVFVACVPIVTGEASTYHPLTEGPHAVKLKGVLPGLGELVTSETTVDLRCPGPADAGTMPSSDGPEVVVIKPRPVVDANKAAGDTPADGDAEAERAGPTRDSGCRVGTRSSGGASSLVMLLLACTWVRSGRRSKNTPRLPPHPDWGLASPRSARH